MNDPLRGCSPEARDGTCVTVTVEGAGLPDDVNGFSFLYDPIGNQCVLFGERNGKTEIYASDADSEPRVWRPVILGPINQDTATGNG